MMQVFRDTIRPDADKHDSLLLGSCYAQTKTKNYVYCLTGNSRSRSIWLNKSASYAPYKLCCGGIRACHPLRFQCGLQRSHMVIARTKQMEA